MEDTPAMNEQNNDMLAPIARAADATSRALVGARRQAHTLAEFPGDLPHYLADAYMIQSLSIRRWPDSVAGWKVGGIPPEHREDDGIDRLAGPVFARTIREADPDGDNTMPIFDGGFAAVEAEFVLRIGADVAPVQRGYTDVELMQLVAAVHVGAEIASSPMPMINDIGPRAVISDFGNNAGLLVGPEVENWHEQPLSALTIRVDIDGERVGEAACADGSAGPLGSLRFLLASLARRGIPLARGSLITTGAITGIHEVTTASVARITASGLGSFSVRFEAIQATE